jgi:hypothetical protein
VKTSTVSRAAGIALLLAALVLAPAALAGKGGGGGKGHGGSGTTGGGTIHLVLLDSTDGLAHWGQRVTYTVSTTATASPYVSTTCYKGKTLVLSTSAGFFPSYPWPDAQVVPLQTQVWTSGDADCTARLYSMDGGSQTVLNTLSFHAYA